MSEPRETAERFHELDAVRAAAMLLGIFFHGAISFMATPIPWAIRDRSVHLGVDLFLWVCHTFRMPVFFLMSGFFARLLCLKLGLGGFLRHRARRVLLPFAAALIPTMVAVYFLWRWGWSIAPPPGKTHPGFEVLSLELSKITPSPAHLWFLYYLLFLFGGQALLVAAGRRLPGASPGPRLDALFRWAASSWLLPFLMAIPTGVTLFFMHSIEAGTPVSFVPQPRLLAYYAVFFAFGWMLHRQPILIDGFRRRLWLNLALAALALPGLGWLLQHAPGDGVIRPASLRVGALWLSAFFGWALGLAFIGFFVRWLREPRPWVRWLSDASYWCYLLHLPVVVLFQILAAGLAWPGPVKYVLVMAATLAICFGSYRGFVRYTFLGAALNGRRER